MEKGCKPIAFRVAFCSTHLAANLRCSEVSECCALGDLLVSREWTGKWGWCLALELSVAVLVFHIFCLCWSEWSGHAALASFCAPWKDKAQSKYTPSRLGQWNKLFEVTKQNWEQTLASGLPPQGVRYQTWPVTKAFEIFPTSPSCIQAESSALSRQNFRCPVPTATPIAFGSGSERFLGAEVPQQPAGTERQNAFLELGLYLCSGKVPYFCWS